jgi:hypothetical protein
MRAIIFSKYRPPGALAIKPAVMSWEEVASISLAGGVSKETAENLI